MDGNGFRTRILLRGAVRADPPSAFLPNAHDLGTPMGEERLRAIRREKRYRRVFKIAMWILIMLCGTAIGYNASHPRKSVSTGIDYRVKGAQLAVNARACALDPHEGCLVCMHKDRVGGSLISTHC